MFLGLGFQVAEGPEVETDWYNFEALNMPPGPPGPVMWDTLYVELGEPEDSRAAHPHLAGADPGDGVRQAPPIYTVMPGRVLRRDTPDARHCRSSTRSRASSSTGASPSATWPAPSTPSPRPTSAPAITLAAAAVLLPVHRAVRRVRGHLLRCDGAGCSVCSRPAGSSSAAAGWSTPTCFRAVGIDPEEYTGFAFGFGHRPDGHGPLRRRATSSCSRQRRPVPEQFWRCSVKVLSPGSATSPRSSGTPLELADRLNGIGLVVEGIERAGARHRRRPHRAGCWRCETHPDADRLPLVDIDPGDGTPSRWCAGPTTCAVGDVVPLAAARRRRCPAA